jgi:16S rRNA processing protein RimM
MTGRRSHINTANAGDTAEWVAVGQITAVFGIHGELRVAPLSDLPDRFMQLSTLYVGDAHVPYKVAGVRQHKGQPLVRLKGIDTVEQAERLRGQMLWIPDAEIAALPPDEYYLHDLVGMRVERTSGVPLGEVADVLTGAGNDLFVIRTPGGREVLLPAVKEFVKAVDLAARVVRVEPIPGLFDDAAEVAR